MYVQCGEKCMNFVLRTKYSVAAMTGEGWGKCFFKKNHDFGKTVFLYVIGQIGVGLLNM